MAIDLYQAVTDKILTQMEQGTAPWVRPWTRTQGGMFFNAVSGKAYRGINTMMLWSPAGAAGAAQKAADFVLGVSAGKLQTTV